MMVLLFFTCISFFQLVNSSPIKNIVVLMFENRAFDHMLGHLSLVNPEIDGLNNGAQRCNYEDPQNTTSPLVCVNFDAVDGGPSDVCHSFDCITQQVYGFNKPNNDTTSVPLMNGFAANAIAEKVELGFAFSAHNATNLPVLSTLAMEFALFDVCIYFIHVSFVLIYLFYLFVFLFFIFFSRFF